MEILKTPLKEIRATSSIIREVVDTNGIPILQSDWNQVDNTALDYIKNKPIVPKIYTTTGTNVDGAMTQKAVTQLIDTNSASFNSSLDRLETLIDTNTEAIASIRTVVNENSSGLLEVRAAVDNLDYANIAVVNELPAVNIDQKTLYIIPKEGVDVNTADEDAYRKYIRIGNRWEEIGGNGIDTSRYLKKSYEGYVDVVNNITHETTRINVLNEFTVESDSTSDDYMGLTFIEHNSNITVSSISGNGQLSTPDTNNMEFTEGTDSGTMLTVGRDYSALVGMSKEGERKNFSAMMLGGVSTQLLSASQPLADEEGTQDYAMFYTCPGEITGVVELEGVQGAMVLAPEGLRLLSDNSSFSISVNDEPVALESDLNALKEELVTLADNQTISGEKKFNANMLLFDAAGTGTYVKPLAVPTISNITEKRYLLGTSDTDQSVTDLNASIYMQDGKLYSDSKEVAVKEDITAAISEIIGSAPEELNTLKELADAYSNDRSILEALSNLVTSHTHDCYLPLTGGTLSGATTIGDVLHLAANARIDTVSGHHLLSEQNQSVVIGNTEAGLELKGSGTTVTYNDSELALKSDVPTTLKSPNSIMFKNGETILANYDGSSEVQLDMSNLLVPQEILLANKIEWA